MDSVGTFRFNSCLFITMITQTKTGNYVTHSAHVKKSPQSMSHPPQLVSSDYLQTSATERERPVLSVELIERSLVLPKALLCSM